MATKQMLLLSIVSCCFAFYCGKAASSKNLYVAQARQGHASFHEVQVDDDVTVGEIRLDGTDNVKSIVSPYTVGKFGRTISTLSLKRFATSCAATFLPVGFPNTTPPEYITFQRWNLIQDLCSYLRGIMSTGALLEGMGVGRAEATALQATILWMYRDGAGMLGSLLFTSLSSYNFGQNIKAWRLFADAINNLGITLDMVAPYFRQKFLLIVCAASVCKALCGVAAGATGAAIAEHWGEAHGNIADVLAKNGAQHTMVSMVGLLATVPFATFTSASPVVAGGVYAALTAVHMFANWRAMRVLALRTLNPPRCCVLLETLLSPLGQRLHGSNGSDSNSRAIYSVLLDKSLIATISNDMSVTAVAKRERIFSLHGLCSPWERSTTYINKNARVLDIQGTINNVKLWTAPSTIAQLYDTKNILKAMEMYRKCNYFMLRSAQSGSVHVCFRHGASGQDQLQAWLEGCLLQLTDRAETARELCDTIAPPFFAQLREQGWKVDLPQLRPRGARAFTNFQA